MAVAKYHEFIPHASLQDHVKCLWILEATYTADSPTEEVMPDACVELIMNFGSPYQRVVGSTTQPLPPVCLIGLHTKPLVYSVSGTVKVVAVRFFAHGAFPFFRLEALPAGATALDL